MSELHEIISAQHRRRLGRVVAAVVTASALVCVAALVRVAIAHADPKSDVLDVTAAPLTVPPPVAPAAAPLAPAPEAAHDAGLAPAPPKKHGKHAGRGLPR